MVTKYLMKFQSKNFATLFEKLIFWYNFSPYFRIHIQQIISKHYQAMSISIFSTEFIAQVAEYLETDAKEVSNAFASAFIALSKSKKAVPKTKAAPKKPAKGKKAPVEEDASGDEAEPDLSKMTVAQLKVLCGERELKTSGAKAVLIARLNGEEDADEDEPKKAKAAPKGKASKAKAPAKGKSKAKKVESEEEASEPEADAEVSAEKDYSKMTVAELKALLDERELPKTGKKEDLVERLREADGKGAVDGEEEPEVEEEADADEE